MTKYFSAMVDVLCLRWIARKLAYEHPVVTLVVGRLLMVFGVVWFVLSASGLIQGRVDLGSALIDLLVFVFVIVLAWALLGATNEVYCRLEGLPVRPW
jgi:hypothetical protein